MKLPITLILIFVLFQLSCTVDQDEIHNEETLDKMTGKWEKVSQLSKRYDGGYEETYFPDSTYIQLTIRKNEDSPSVGGSWIDGVYSKSDSVLVSFPKNWNSLTVSGGGTKCQFSSNGGVTNYTVNFVENNLILNRIWNDLIEFKITYTPLD